MSGVAALIEAATRALDAAGSETGQADAEWLMAGLLGTGRLTVYLEREVSPATAERYQSAVRRRATGEPLQQILGWEEFRGLRLAITPDVLIPRPETELLVEWALELLPSTDDRRVVVDVGTGSGAIACALACERRTVDVIAIDVSPAAARVARRNVVAQNLAARARVVVADLVSAVRPSSADLVVSNPPYLASAMLGAAPREVREHEPPVALAGGDDGLAVLRRLVSDATRVLKPGGALVVETAGTTQVDTVAALFRDHGYEDVAVRSDLAGVRRFVSGRRPRLPSAGGAGTIESAASSHTVQARSSSRRSGGYRGGAALPPPDLQQDSGRSGARSHGSVLAPPPDVNQLAKLEIEGGVPLKGTVSVSAAKNAALPALAASLLTPEPVVVTNVPSLGDVRTMLRLLETLGASVARDGAHARVQTARLASDLAPYELVSTMRASVLVLGPLVARHGSARVALPGGCAIGVRPIDQHLRGLAKLGAEVSIENGYVVARATRLRAARITTDLVTVTGTENLMMAAALADGTTVLENAAREPEVVDLAQLLTAMGARIRGAGTARVEIDGVRELGGATHTVVPDRIEAGTLIVAGAITHGDVTVEDVVPDHLSATLAKLDDCGVPLEVGASWVRVRGAAERPRPADVITSPFPGFPTDMQAQIMTLLGLADGQSRVTETIFENRFMHAAELGRMGASIETEGSTAIIRGVLAYQGAPVMASDLRASAALVLAGLAARGTTEISRVYHLDRGYEQLEIKLQGLGAHIVRTP